MAPPEKHEHDEEEEYNIDCSALKKFCSYKTSCLERPLSALFRRYGWFVGRHPWLVVVTPVVMTMLLSLGFLHIQVESDIEFLFTPRYGPAKLARTSILKHFPVNESGGYQVYQDAQHSSYADVIFSAGHKQLNMNMWNQSNLESIIFIHEKIKSMKVRDEISGEFLSFEHLCVKWGSSCWGQDITNLLQNATQFPNATVYYPFHNGMYLGNTLGQVFPVPNGTEIVLARSAGAVRLQYHLRMAQPIHKARSHHWLDAFQNLMKELQENQTLPQLGYYTTLSMAEEVDKIRQDVLPLVGIMYAVLVIFSVVMSTQTDSVRSKPGLGLCGSITAGMATISSCGILLVTGVGFTSELMAMPLLTLGIGLDDTFILIAAWRGTPSDANVSDRLGTALGEAALAITITSLTNVLAFGIGMINMFPSVQIFCLYTGVCLVFSYFYAITFFTGCMALDGQREAANRHCITMKKVPERTQTSLERRGGCFLFCCTSGTLSKQSTKGVEHYMMNFFRQGFGPMLMLPLVKYIVLLCYLLWLGVALWGCLHLELGLDRRHLANDESYVNTFYNYEDENFRCYGPRVMVVIMEPLTYSRNDTKDYVHRISQQLQESHFFLDDFNDLWLEKYHAFLETLPEEKKPKSELEFIDLFFSQFVHKPGNEKHFEDISISSDGKSIVASRFYVQARSLANVTEEKNMMVEARKIVAGLSKEIVVYHPSFVFLDQFVASLENILKNLGIAAGAMLLVSLLLVPHLTCAFWVALSIVSIEVGVVGFMAAWGVPLDAISMVALIACSGYSVDFAVHVSYSYITSPKKLRDEKAVDALYKTGFPMMQAALSTILAISALAASHTHMFRTLFKTLLLASTFGLAHGLFVLPVFLSIVGLTVDVSGTGIDSRDGIEQKVSSGEESGNKANNNKFLPSVSCQTESDLGSNGYNVKIAVIEVDNLKGQMAKKSCMAAPKASKSKVKSQKRRGKHKSRQKKREEVNWAVVESGKAIDESNI